MPKINLVTVNTPLNSSSFQQEINSNFTAIEGALEKQLQREPQEGVNNAMQQELDMNSYRIINLGAPINPSDAARKQDVDDVLIASASQLANLTDVSLNSPENGQVLSFNASSQKWENASIREHYQGDYDPTLSYNKGDVVFYGSIAYIASQDVPEGIEPTKTAYWKSFNQDGLVNYKTADTSNEYPVGCTNTGISGDIYGGSLYYMGTSSPTINGSTGAMSAPLLKSTTQAQGDNSTNVATTEYVDTAVAGAGSQPVYNSSTNTLEF